MASFDPKQIAEKWTKIWQAQKIYQPDLKTAKNPYYNLMMFPYPSAEGLHVGNMYAFTGADVYGRFMRMMGNDIFEPIGLDGFGIHSENYALKIGAHPMDQSKISEKRFYEQLREIGNGFDWDHTVETYKPGYYKWTQWIFTTLFKAGLAVKKKAPVNWCPSCKTVLADEQVIDGKCERCGTVVETRDLEQWFFRITKYADKLLEGIDRIDWSEKVLQAQRNWIGKSDGARIRFPLVDSKLAIEIFTTRPDTLYGATFMVVSPFHPILSDLNLSGEARNYIAKAEKKVTYQEEKEKTGVFTGTYAINPVNNEKIPVWIADYVLMTYGTGAIMAVPAHDERDFEFAKKYELPIKQVVLGEDVELTSGDKTTKAHEGEGKLVNSGPWNNIKVPQDISLTIEDLEKRKLGKRESNYHLRDWLISRQRYWGAPIPMIYCEKCFEAKKSYFNTPSKKVPENLSLEVSDEGFDQMPGWFPVEDNDLPVTLPYIKNFKPLGTGEAPLASDPKFVKTTCPNCGSEAKRETDVCDTFLDSSWYFLRYPSTAFDMVPFDPETTKKWLPVDMYIGGAEHSVLHLLYSRFVTKVLFDLGLLGFDEPFPKFRAHGLIIKDGAKMSKSKGNVVNPDEYIAKFGTDAVRLYLMFLGPFSQGGDFRDSGMEGMARFVKRVNVFIKNQLDMPSANFFESKTLDISQNLTIKNVSKDISELSYNTAIAKIMEYVNSLTKEGNDKKLGPKYIETLILLLAPFAPFMTEELFEAVGSKTSVHNASWPKYEEKLTHSDEVTIAIQINGKLKDTVIGSLMSLEQKDIEALAREKVRVREAIKDREILKVIYVEGKIINFVLK